MIHAVGSACCDKGSGCDVADEQILDMTVRREVVLTIGHIFVVASVRGVGDGFVYADDGCMTIHGAVTRVVVRRLSGIGAGDGTGPGIPKRCILRWIGNITARVSYFKGLNKRSRRIELGKRRIVKRKFMP